MCLCLCVCLWLWLCLAVLAFLLVYFGIYSLAKGKEKGEGRGKVKVSVTVLARLSRCLGPYIAWHGVALASDSIRFDSIRFNLIRRVEVQCNATRPRIQDTLYYIQLSAVQGNSTRSIASKRSPTHYNAVQRSLTTPFNAYNALQRRSMQSTTTMTVRFHQKTYNRPDRAQ